MKKLLVVAVAIASANAFATRARVTALGNAPHLVDTETAYSNPADYNLLGDFVNFESGKTTGTTDSDYAKGQVSRSYGNSKLALALGNQSKNASVWGLRQAAATGIAGIKNQQNPINLSYASKIDDLGFGATLVYSNFNDKAASEKESSAGVRFGIRSGAWDAKLGVGLINKYENATDVFKGTNGYSAAVGYAMDSGCYIYGGAELAGFKTEDNAGAEKRKLDFTSFNVGYAHSNKKDGNEIFWGIGLKQDNQKLNIVAGSVEQKTTSLVAPAIIGFETEANSWMVLRGSLTQNIVLSNSKTETNGSTTAETAPGLNTTAAAVGTGFKYNSLMVDATLQGLTGATATQDVNGTNLLAKVGMTYKF